MQRRGATAAMVNTALDNEAALALYADLGFRRRSETLTILELDGRRPSPALVVLDEPARRAARSDSADSMIGLAIGALSLGAGTITALSGPVASSALGGAKCGAPVQRSGDRADRARVHPRGRRRAPPRLPAERNTRRQRRHRPREQQRQPQPRRPRQFLRRTRAPRAAPTTAPLPSATTAAAAPTTTVPPLRTLTVDVANFAAITDINDAEELLGGRATPGAFQDNIDGVRITDVRAAVEVVDTNTAFLTVTVAD